MDEKTHGPRVPPELQNMIFKELLEVPDKFLRIRTLFECLLLLRNKLKSVEAIPASQAGIHSAVSCVQGLKASYETITALCHTQKAIATRLTSIVHAHIKELKAYVRKVERLFCTSSILWPTSFRQTEVFRAVEAAAYQQSSNAEFKCFCQKAWVDRWAHNGIEC